MIDVNEAYISTPIDDVANAGGYLGIIGGLVLHQPGVNPETCRVPVDRWKKRGCIGRLQADESIR